MYGAVVMVEVEKKRRRQGSELQPDLITSAESTCSDAVAAPDPTRPDWTHCRTTLIYIVRPYGRPNNRPTVVEVGVPS